MSLIKFIELVLLNAVSAAMHTDTHFGATKNLLLVATLLMNSNTKGQL